MRTKSVALPYDVIDQIQKRSDLKGNLFGCEMRELIEIGLKHAEPAGRELKIDPNDPTWNPLLVTTRSEASYLVKKVFKKKQPLTKNGYQPGEFDGQEFLEDLEMVAASMDFIKELEVNKGFNYRHSSYGLKHWVENLTELEGSCIYVANGAFIVAAVGLGFEYANPDHGLNVYFKFSEKSLTRQLRRMRLRSERAEHISARFRALNFVPETWEQRKARLSR